MLNRDRYLDVNRTFASRARIREIPADVFLGAVIDPALADPVFLNRGPVSDLLVPKLRWHLTHGSAVVRGEAALALGKIGGAEEVPLLVAMTRDRNRFVRQLALLGLGLTRTEAALQVLASFAVSSAEQTADRAYAVLGLGLVGSDDALLPLSTLLHRGAGDRNLAAATLYALGFVPDSNAGELLRQFVRERGNRGDERAVATLALGKLGSSGDVPLLLRLLGDPEVHVRRSAALALGQVGYRSELPTRRDALLIKLERWNEGRVISAEARRRLEDHLAHLGRRAARETRDLKNLERRVIATLAVALDRDRDSMVRQFSAIALGRIGSPQARVHLAKTFKKTGGVSAARGFVALALGISDAREASDLLRGNLGRKGLDASSRSAVVLALGLMEDMNAGPDLVALALGRGSPELRAAAAISCGMMNHRKAKTAFRVQLRDRTHAFLRPMFGLALGLLGDREALDTLEELVIEGSSSMARIQAVQALASIRDLASVKVLCELLERPDITDAVRASALHAVGQIAEKGVLPGLEALARDWNYLLPFSVINDAVLR